MIKNLALVCDSVTCNSCLCPHEGGNSLTSWSHVWSFYTIMPNVRNGDVCLCESVLLWAFTVKLKSNGNCKHEFNLGYY